MEKQTKKKVLYVITKSNFGGAQRYVYDLATNLDRNTFDVAVALGGDGELKDRLVSAGVAVYTISGMQRDISFFSEIRSLWSFGKIISDIDPDILHVNSSKAGAIGTFLGRLLGVPRIIFTTHGWAFNEKRSLMSRLLIRYVHWLTVMLSHRTIAVSHETKSQLPGHFVQKKMHVVHNGSTPPTFLNRAQARAGLAAHTPALTHHMYAPWTISVGELHHIKNHAITIDAYAALSDTDAKHIIIGGGEEMDYLQKHIEENNLTDTVFLAGAIPDAAALLKAADIFILPSRSEAFPYVLLEAAHAGLPIIASRVGGIPEVVTNGENGTLIPPNESDALRDALQALLDDSALQDRYRTAIQERSTDFTVSTMVENTLKIYT